jgi:cell division septation protein DedD
MVRKKTPSSKGNKAKYQIEMSSLSLFFWGLCLCLLLTWVFILGVFVGRGFLPMAEVKTQIAKWVPHGKQPAPETPKVADAPRLDFFHALEDKKEEVKKKSPAEDRKKQEPPARPSAERKEQAPPSGVRPAEKPPGNGGAGQYTVQLAALEDRGKAESLVRSLKEKGFEAYSYEVKVQGKTYYRIRCGRFKAKEEAVNHQKKLSEKAKINGIVSKFD